MEAMQIGAMDECKDYQNKKAWRAKPLESSCETKVWFWVPDCCPEDYKAFYSAILVIAFFKINSLIRNVLAARNTTEIAILCSEPILCSQ